MLTGNEFQTRELKTETHKIQKLSCDGTGD